MLHTQCCKSIILSKQTNKLIEKERRFVIARGRGCMEGGMNESSLRVQTSSYKINKYYKSNIQLDKGNNTVVCFTEKLTEQILRFPITKEKCLLIYLFNVI